MEEWILTEIIPESVKNRFVVAKLLMVSTHIIIPVKQDPDLYLEIFGPIMYSYAKTADKKI